MKTRALIPMAGISGAYFDRVVEGRVYDRAI
jgi:hypothetical protein